MMDRLEEIESRDRTELAQFSMHWAERVTWLIAEVKRQRKEADVTFVNAAHDAVAKLEVAEAQLVEKDRQIRELLDAKDCSNCPNQGWWQGVNRNTGEPEQVQCEYCYTDPNSVFNVRNRIRQALAEKGAADGR